jgi:ketosteroid isomerase-like protein
LSHHLKALGSGKLDEVLDDYVEDSVVVRPDGTIKGLRGIRAVFEGFLSGLFEPGTYELALDVRRVEGEVAYIIWQAKCASADILFAIGSAYRQVFGRHYPATTLVEVRSLFDPEALVEIDAIAVCPQ